MPSLKDLSCSIELADPQQTLQEYGSTYGDGFLETFVAVPSEARPFAVRLTSNAYIAEGLAMYVFIDGVYQCNRNQRGLKDRRRGSSSSDKPLSPRHTLVDFVVRQKEETQKCGEMIAREWKFEKLNTGKEGVIRLGHVRFLTTAVSADRAPELCSSNIVENIGCIEVVVLRCKGSRDPTARFQNMGFDGVNDMPDDYFGGGGQPSEWNYDGRAWLPQGREGNHRSPHLQTTANR